MNGRIGPLRQLVLQPTSFCNLDCTYCYLPDRRSHGVMPREVVAATLAFLNESGLLGPTLEVRWHAGEPLVAGQTFYRTALDQIARGIPSTTAVQHSLQTNGVLLTPEWVDLFRDLDFRVGVSIDGPREIHDRHRRTRAGSGSFDRAMTGVRHLQARQVPFDVIAVVTAETLQRPSPFFDFFASLTGLRELELNIEETEGSHNSQTLASPGLRAAIQSFVVELAAWSDRTGIPVRELRSMRERILFGGETIANAQNVPFAIVTVARRGEISTFSPELLGLRYGEWDSFALGNVLQDSTAAILQSARLAALSQAIDRGKERCRTECAYYFLCGGGAPVNKLFENGTFASTRTRHCEWTVVEMADFAVAELESLRMLPVLERCG